MPYIKDIEVRARLDKIVLSLELIIAFKGLTVNLNYFLFKLAKRNCKSYSDYQKFLGELEACKLEIYRRLAAPYDDKKIKENGDA